MDQSFPEASEEDLQRADHTCIICREEMAAQGARRRRGTHSCWLPPPGQPCRSLRSQQAKEVCVQGQR
jgi:hypothetical protein